MFHQLGHTMLPDLMDWPVASQWSPIHWLSLHWYTHHLQVVGLPSYSASFATYRVVSQQLPCATVFAVFHSSVYYRPQSHVLLCNALQSWTLSTIMLISVSFCTLCTSNLWAMRVFTVIASSVTSIVNTSLKISMIMPSSSSSLFC